MLWLVISGLALAPLAPWLQRAWPRASGPLGALLPLLLTRRGHPQFGRLYAFLLFIAAMLGVVLADNVLVLFAFRELTSFSSFLLIGTDHDSATARAAALKALLVTSGGLALLAGLLLRAQAGGSQELSRLIGQGAALRAHPSYLPARPLLLAGACAKSAQFPFHFWLPAAMAALAPVSAYLQPRSGCRPSSSVSRGCPSARCPPGRCSGRRPRSGPRGRGPRTCASSMGSPRRRA